MSDVIFFYAANGRRDGIALCSAQYGQNQLCGRLLGAWVHPATGIVAFLQSNNKASRSGRLLEHTLRAWGEDVPKTVSARQLEGSIDVQNDDVSLERRRQPCWKNNRAIPNRSLSAAMFCSLCFTPCRNHTTRDLATN
jgi:hypothetical protein